MAGIRMRADDFSGRYTDLTQKPQLFSGNYNDLANLPNLYTQNQVDSAIAASGASASQSLSLTGTQLSISGGNSINFNKWDTNVLDDFSGSYNDLTNKPTLFTGNYNDLTNTPSFSGWDTDASDDFSGDYNDLVNVPNFSDWDQNAADDFSGDFSDLNNLPALYTKSQVDSAIGANAGSGELLKPSACLAAN
ncbi:MAG: hypothetical protein U5L96_10830 [Owenweeksia sp.]|nr:hypothetical protein [Owenweeksia sp.]